MGISPRRTSAVTGTIAPATEPGSPRPPIRHRSIGQGPRSFAGRELLHPGQAGKPDNSKAQMLLDRSLPPEIRLVLYCARTVLDAATQARVADLLDKNLDWLRVVRFALENRIVPLLHRGFASLAPDSIPVELMEPMQRYSATTTANNLALAHVLLEALDALARKGITAIPFKGPVLALSAFGNLYLRQFFDLDLLVREHDVKGAREVFEALGYSEIRKRLTWETEFRRAGAAIDLHWRIAPARMVEYWIGFDFDLSGACGRRQPTALLGRDVDYFSAEDALLVQCQSSIKNGFNRSLAQLRWVCDIAELVRAHPDLAWDTMLARATALRSRRALLVCLDLAHTLLGAPLPGTVLQAIRKDPLTAYLRRRLTLRYVAVEPWRPVALAEQLLYASLVKDTLADRLPYLKRCAASLIQPNARDRDFIRLPRRLRMLYYLVRPVRLCFSPFSTRTRKKAWTK